MHNGTVLSSVSHRDRFTTRFFTRSTILGQTSAAAGIRLLIVGLRLSFGQSARIIRSCGPLVKAACLSLALLAANRCLADIIINDQRMVIKTPNLEISFDGPDIVALTNRITGEQVAYGSSRGATVTAFESSRGARPAMRCTGWRQGSAALEGREAAMTTYHDLERTITIKVVTDGATGDVTVSADAVSRVDRTRSLTLGLRNVDLSGASVILPTREPLTIDSRSTPQSGRWTYPGELAAQMVILQAKLGGVVIYSRDEDAVAKQLVLARRGNYADLGLVTEAPAPWEQNDTVPLIEWRINAYKGDWKVPARGYNGLLGYLKSPVIAAGRRAWLDKVERVVEVPRPAISGAIIKAIAAGGKPAATLLLLRDWRASASDAHLPDYEPSPEAAAAIDQAHQAGMHVMLRVSACGVDAASSGEWLKDRLRVLDPVTMAPVSARWAEPGSLPEGHAVLSPAGREWRTRLLRSLANPIETLRPDALLIADDAVAYNDGGGLRDSLPFVRGLTALLRALLTQQPGLVLASEAPNEVTAPYLLLQPVPGLAPDPPPALVPIILGDRLRRLPLETWKGPTPP